MRFKDLYNPREKQDLSAHCFAGGDGTPLVNHRGKSEAKWEALFDVLTGAGCPIEIVLLFLTKDGRWNQAYFDQFNRRDHNSLNDKALESIFTIATTPLLEAAQYSLDTSFEYGYNDHRPPHIKRVAQMSQNLLASAHQPKDVMRRGMIVARNHDTFNLLSRALHQHGAGLILRKILPSLAENEKEFHIIDKAMHLHTEAVAEKVFAAIIEENPSVMKHYGKILELIGPEALAVIIADKIDLCPERAINVKGLSREAILNDPHFLLNLVATTSNFKVSEGRSKVFWDVMFSPQAILSLSIGSAVKNVVKDNLEIFPNVEEWFNSFWNIYFDRLRLVALSTFSLYPTVNEMVVTVFDCSVEERPPTPHKITLTRALVSSELEEYRAKYTHTVAAA